VRQQQSAMGQVSTLIVVLAIIFGTAMVQAAVGFNAVLLPVRLEEYGYGKSLIGICLSMEVAAVVLISKYITRIIARLGIFGALALATGIRVGVLFLVASSRNWVLWCVCVFFFGMNTNIMLISLQTWINTIPMTRFKGLAIGSFSSALSLGTASGPVMVHLAGIDGGARPFHVNMAIVAFTLLPFLLLAKFIPKIPAGPKLRLGFVLRMAKIAMFSSLVGGVTFYGLPAFLTLYGMMNGLSVERASYLISLFMLGSITLGLGVCALSDFLNRTVVIVVCVFVGVLCAVYLPLAIYTYPVALGLLFVWGGAAGGIYGTGLAIVGDMFRKEDQVSANVAYSLMDCLGGVIGVNLIGFSMDFEGSDGIVYVIILAALVYFIYCLSKVRVD